MRNVFLLICCALAMFAVIGCSGPKTGTVATTDEDEIAEYNRMINEGEGEDPEPEE